MGSDFSLGASKVESTQENFNIGKMESFDTEIKTLPENERFGENGDALVAEAREIPQSEVESWQGDRPFGGISGSVFDVSEYSENIIKNKLDGLERENDVEKELKEKYPESEGYTVESEKPLRDENGNIVRDPETGEYRRIDFVVIKDGEVVDMVEVTSKTADKTEQTNKENRIRENGGNYIRTDDGELVRIPDNVNTRIERRD